MSYLRRAVWFRKLILILMDAVLVMAATYLALLLRFETIWSVDFDNTLAFLPAIVCVYLAALAIGGIYDVLWKYAGVNEALRLSLLSVAACMVLLLINRIFLWSLSRAMLAIMALLVIVLIGGVRIAGRLLKRTPFFQHRLNHRQITAGPRLMIVGAGAAGAYALQMCKNDPGLGQPILFVDDARAKQGLCVQGVKVRGKSDDIPALVEKYSIQDILIAIPSLKGKQLNELVAKCKETPCRVRISSRIENSDDACKPSNLFVRELNVSDFLSRDEVQLDTEGIGGYLTARTVLVTGGGGSIGSELCRQIIRFAPKRLVIFDIYENCAYELECELRQKYGADCPVKVLIGSVRDAARLDEVFAAEKPDVVFHAAAHKHVPLMEDSPAEAIKNNVFGTLNVLETADRHHVNRFVLLSTDKAVNPTNVMGATKRITEMLIQYFAKRTDMKCMAVRFGNVLGSHGSVIPLFERQIKAGGPVTVTHPDIIRYFMTIPEAAQLVLQAGAIARSGSIFVLDMGEPVRIYDLAEQLVRFYGYEPNGNMEIKITGLRPGEKLYEELLNDDERNAMERTEHDRIMIAPPIPQEADVFESQLMVLRAASEYNDERAVAVIRQVVPGYHVADGESSAKAG